jgi:hypothetical protein
VPLLRRLIPSEYVLLLLFLLTRLHNLLSLPPFFDEVVHLRWAKLVWAYQPFHAASDGRLLNIWAYAAFFPFGEALWIGRAVTVLAGVLGFAALLALGRRLCSRRAALLGGLLYIALPWAFFYDRMALADSFAAPLVPLALWFAVRAVGENGGKQEEIRARRAAWLAGVALAALVLTKLTDLLFVPIPLVALLFCAQGGQWRRGLGNAARAYLAAAILLAAAVALLKGLGRSDLGFDLIVARTEAAPLAARLSGNLRTLAGFVPAYLTWPVLALFAAGTVAAVLRRAGPGWAPLAILALPLAAMLAGSNVSESRFLAPVLPLAALVAGWGFDRLLAWAPARLRFAALALGLIVIWASGPAPFLWLAWHEPARLPLTAWDRYQYIEEWPAGFGLREAARLVFGPGTERPLDVIVSDEGHIPQLSLYAPWEPGLHSLYAFGDGGVRLLHLPPGFHNPYGGLADPSRIALYIVEVPRYQAERDTLGAELTLLVRFPRPGGRSVIEVYEVERSNP